MIQENPVSSKWLSEYDPRIRLTEGWNIPDPELLNLEGPGCPIGCVFCNQVFMDRGEDGVRMSSYLSPYDGGISFNTRLMVGNKTVATIEPEILITELSRYPYYTTETPVVVENFTDPGLNWEKSVELATQLRDDLGHDAATIFITKMPMSDKQVDLMKDFQINGGKPIVIVTYSGMPSAIEEVSEEKRLATIRALYESSIPVIVSLRPIVKGINDSEENFSYIAREVKDICHAVIYGGLFVDPSYTKRAFEDAGYPLDQIYIDYMYTRAKLLPDEIRDRVRRVFHRENVQVPLFDHTTCATAYLETTFYNNPRPNRMALWVDGESTNFGKCRTMCPSEQTTQCVEAFNRPEEEAIRRARNMLTRIDPDGRYQDLTFIPSNTQRGMLLIKDGALNILELMPIMQASGRRIDNFPDIEGFLFRSREALSHYLGIDDKVIMGAVREGQEWILLVDGDLTGDGNVLATQYVRTNSRCRCNVADFNDFQDLLAQ